MQAGNSYFFRDAPEIAIHSLFDKYDHERNGKLDRSELKDLLEGDLGLNPEQACIYMLLLDQTGEQCVIRRVFQLAEKRWTISKY